mmetsp:Transcript_15617/g.27126  ORF Transcript_15617/g.27126 Transcript_15617/m.27126 type:complete len:288 (-) Transcript_15617:333-1196(-)
MMMLMTMGLDGLFKERNTANEMKIVGKRQPLRGSAVLLIASIALLCQTVEVYPFPINDIPTNPKYSTDTRSTLSMPLRRLPLSPSRLFGTLSWSGDAKASIVVKETKSSQGNGLSIQDWLDDPTASNLALLGTPDVEERNDGLFHCRQPGIDFLGLALQPIFVNKIDRTKNGTATVSIMDAQTEIKGGNSGRTANLANNAIQGIMQDSKFQGRSVIRANDKTLSVDLTLTLNVSLPPFVLLPPGFNNMGIAIIKRTGQARSKQLLQDLHRNYQEWVVTNQKQEQEQT